VFDVCVMYFSNTLVYAFNRADRDENCAAFWNVETDTKHVKYVMCVCDVCKMCVMCVCVCVMSVYVCDVCV